MSFAGGKSSDLFGDWRDVVEQRSTVRASIVDFTVQVQRSCQLALLSEDEESQGARSYCKGRAIPPVVPSSHPRRSSVPDLSTWVAQRVGTRFHQVVTVLVLAMDSAKFVLTDHVFNEEKRSVTASMVVAAQALFFITCIPAVMAASDTTGEAFRKIFNLHALWRASIISALFMFAKFSVIYSYRAGITPIFEKTLGQIYLPIAAMFSVVLFRRRYGQLEKIALWMMVLAVATFILIRERCAQSDRYYTCVEGFGADDLVFDNNSWFIGFGWVVVSCFSSVIASLLAERMIKGQSLGLHLRGEHVQSERFSIGFAHIGLCQLLIGIAFWAWPLNVDGTIALKAGWLGRAHRWDYQEYVMILVMVGQMWGAALFTKCFSTVVRSIITSLAIISSTCLFDKLFDEYDFRLLMGPAICMFTIFSLSALIFQTGRIHIKSIEQSLEPKRKPEIVELSVTGLIREVRNRNADRTARWLSPEEEEGDIEQDSHMCVRVFNLLREYWCIIAYIVADAARTELQIVAVSKTMITPQSMAVAVNMCSLILFNVFAFSGPRQGSTGFQDLRYAWDIRKIIKFLPCGIFFAATNALMSMAIGLGISGAMQVVVGKIYTPVCALGSRFVLGKLYIWIEWFAIIILTMGSVCFGLLQESSVSLSYRQVLPIICVVAAAVASATNSLLMEKMMKSESDPFNILKIRLDCGTLFCSVVFLPIMGYLADEDTYPQGAFWRERPLTRECSKIGTCSASTFVFRDPADEKSSSCSCGKGVFICWDNPTNYALYVFLMVAVLHSTVTGMVVRKFSSVYRAVADSFSLLLVYFVGDPLILNKRLDDAATNLTALILPLSSQLFSQATEELRKVKEKKQQLRTRAETASSSATTFRTESDQ